MMIARHLDMECEVSKHRRSILLEAKKRKEWEKREEEARRLQMKIEREKLLKHLSEIRNERMTGDAIHDVIDAGGMMHNGMVKDDDEVILVSRMKMCLQCNIEVKESMLPTHMNEQCTHRLILCPNYSMGCKEKFIVLNTIQFHLIHECQVEKHRDVMVAKSKHRRGIVL